MNNDNRRNFLRDRINKLHEKGKNTIFPHEDGNDLLETKLDNLYLQNDDEDDDYVVPTDYSKLAEEVVTNDSITESLIQQLNSLTQLQDTALIVSVPNEEEPTEEEKKDEESYGMFSNFINAASDVISGIESNFTHKNVGEASLNNNKIYELLKQRDFLLINKEREEVRSALNQSRYGDDIELTRSLEKKYREINPKYEEGLEEYKKIASKYYDTVGYLKTCSERISAIDKEIEKLNKENLEILGDLQEYRDLVNLHNSIYSTDDKWKENKLNKWLYQLPEGIGTSISSIFILGGTMLTTFLARSAATALANSPALAGGPWGAFVNGASAVLAGSTAVLANVWSRDQESKAEVAGAYSEFIREYAEKNNIPMEEIVEYGREKLREKLNDPSAYSTDKAMLSYRDDLAVLEDMLAYNIPLQQEDLEKVKNESRKHLQNLYDKNMALSTSDIAQTLVLVPGAGKIFGDLLTKADVLGKASNKVVKLLDKAIDYTQGKVKFGDKLSGLKTFNKYTIPAVTKLGATGLMEGNEEVTLFMLTREFKQRALQNADQESYHNLNLYNPIDVASAFLSDNMLLGEGMLALAGLHDDPALNNNKELSDSFKVGSAVGMIMGGVSTIGGTYSDIKSHSKGKEVGERYLMVRTMKARDDMYKYMLYADKAMGKFLSKESFINGINEILNSNSIPEGMTAEQLEKEKSKISNIFDLVQNHKIIKKLPKEKRAAAAAYAQYTMDRYAKAQEDYKSLVNDKNLNGRIDLLMDEFMKINGIPEDYRDLIKEYITLNTKKDSFENYLESLKSYKDAGYSLDEGDSFIISFSDKLKYINQGIRLLEKQIKDLGLGDKIKSDDRFMGGVTDDLSKLAIKINIAEMQLNKLFYQDMRGLTNKNFLESKADAYLQSIKDNEELDLRLKENIEAEELERKNEDSNIEDEEDDLSSEDLSKYSSTSEQSELTESELLDEDTTNSFEEEIKPLKPSGYERNEPEQPEEDDDSLDLEDQSENGFESETELETENEQDSLDETEPDANLDPNELNPNDLPEDAPKNMNFSEEEALKLQLETLEQLSQLDEPLFTPELIQLSLQLDKDSDDLYMVDQASENQQPLTTEDNEEYSKNFQTSGVQVVYKDTTDKMVEGYKSGHDINELFSKPGEIEKSKFSAFIPDPSTVQGFDQNDRSTWDSFPIYVQIEDSNGNKYAASLRKIDTFIKQQQNKNGEVSKEAVESLRKTRNEIIEAKLEDKDATVSFNEIYHLQGMLNKNVIPVNKAGVSYNKHIYRNLADIKGFNMPSDPHDYTNSDKNGGILYGYGKGIQDSYLIVDKNGLPLRGRGGSGKIFIYPAANSTLDRVLRPIQLTEERFRNEDGTANEAAVTLAKSIIYQQSPVNMIGLDDILKVILNYGEHTLLGNNDVRTFLRGKLFYFDYRDNIAYLGEEKLSIDELRNPEGEQKVANFIADNLHWNTDKDILFGKLPESFKKYMQFTGKSQIEPVKGMIIDAEDVGLKKVGDDLVEDSEHPNGLDGISYLIKHGKLKSDLKDDIYSYPSVFVRGVFIKGTRKVLGNPLPEDNNNETQIESSPLDFAETDSLDVDLTANLSEPNIGNSELNENNSYGGEDYSDFFGDDEASAFKTKLKENIGSTKINTVKAQKNLKRIFGDIDVEVKDGFIRTFRNGEVVLGVATLDSITLSKLADYGVEYHEAWHRVSLLMLNHSQRLKIYEAYRKQNPLYKDLNDKLLEEIIADDFMAYMIANESSSAKYIANKFFRKIKLFVEAIKSKLLGKPLNDPDIKSLFESIKYGDFKNYLLNQESINEFKKAYHNQGAFYKIGKNNDVELSTIKTPYEYQQLLNSLVGIFIFSNKIHSISDVRNANLVRPKAMINSLLNNKKTLTDSLKEVLKEVINKFDTIFEDLRPRFEDMGIKGIDLNQQEEQERKEDGFDKTGFEYNKKDNALGNAKLFLHSLPDVYYVYNKVEQDGKTVIQKSKPIVRYDEKTGLPLLVDYDTAFSLVLKYLSDIETFAPTDPNEDPKKSLLGRCAMLGEGKAFFKKLYNRLCNVDLVTETQLLLTIKSFNLNFEEVSYDIDEDGKASFKILDSIHKRAMKIYPENWSNNFFNSNLIIKSNNESVANTEAIKSIIVRFDALFNEAMDQNVQLTDGIADKWLNTLIQLFNECGITIDKDTINVMLDANNRAQSIKDMILNSATGAMKFFFNDTLNSLTKSIGERTRIRNGIALVRQLDQAFVGLGENSFISKLAEAEAQVRPLENEFSVLGPNNSTIYTKTLNCFVSDQIRWLNNKDELVYSDATNDVYNTSSMILNTIKNGGKIKLHTFINFYGNKRNDKGRDYVSISPVEDYIAKMTFTYNDHIVFPTMADKKTWFTITGCKLYNGQLVFATDNNKLSRLYDSQGLMQMYNDWHDEFLAVKKYYSTLSDVKVPIANYHTLGKGGLFRHFTGYYLSSNKWLDLNAKLKDASLKGPEEALKTLDAIEKLLFKTPKARLNTLKRLNRNLIVDTKYEIDKCLELGIIKEDEKGVYSNLLLDNRVLQHYIDIYEASSIPQVREFAEHFAILTMLGNFSMNYQLGIVETEKMFTGDPAFYKDPNDQTKRLGAVLSTGDNMRTQWIAPSQEGRDKKEINQRDYMLSRLTYTTFTLKDNMIQSAQHKKLETLFLNYYVRELLKEREGLSEEDVDNLTTEQIKEQYLDTYNLAMAIGTNDALAYGFNSKKNEGNINQADAAVYVSPRMYKDMAMMLGEWNNQIEEAFDLMEKDESWLTDPKKYRKAVKALIKPLKTTYYCAKYDPTVGRCVPVFNKMAMFPLFKVFASGDLSNLYDRMNAIGEYEGLEKVDQVAFESAVKVGIQGKVSNYTDSENTSLLDLSKANVTTQRYSNLRRQLITEPHKHDRTLFGTLVSTMAVSNLIQNRVYQEGTEHEVTGVQIKERLFGTINALSNKGIEKVKLLFLNKNGVLDLEKTSKQLISDAKASNMGKDMETALQLNETKDDFEIPLAALPDSKWVETDMISTVNSNAIDLKLPGGAFIQMSSFGIKLIKVVSDRTYSVNNGKRLVNVNEDGSMDAVISINLLKHIIPNYKKMSFIEARQWLIDHNVIGEKDGKKSMPMALGYRIPTQGMSSIAGIRITDVLPESVADTIILPDEFTAQTGSDFDIDKLYIARYNYDEKGNIIPFVFPEEELEGEQALYSIYTKTVVDKQKLRFSEWVKNKHNIYDANSKEANENLLLRTYLDVLTDFKNIGETRLPLDKVTDIVKDEIKPILLGEGKEHYIVPNLEGTPTYLLEKKYEFTSGKTGISPFALNDKNHVLTQLVGLKFLKDIPLLNSLGFTGLDGIKSINEFVCRRDKNGKKLIDEHGKSVMHEEQGLKILDWISAMVNAHVDVAKDPYVFLLNVCQYTYNVCNFLLRVGYGKNTFYFLPQPIVKEMSQAYEKARGIYGVDDSKSLTETINDEISEIRSKYVRAFDAASKNLLNKAATQNLNEAIEDVLKVSILDFDVKLGEKTGMLVISNRTNNKIYSIEEYAPFIMRRDNLIDLILNSRKDPSNKTDKENAEYYLKQLMISEIFLQLNSYAEDMSKMVLLSQIDTKKYGGNFVEQDRFVYRLKSLINNTVLFDPNELMNYYLNTFLYTKLNNGVVSPSAFFANTMLRSKLSFKDSITLTLMMINKVDSNNPDLNKIISNEFEALVRQRFIANRTDINWLRMFYGPTSMAARLSRLKSEILSGKYPELRTQDGKITNGLLNALSTLTKLSTDTYFSPSIITNTLHDIDKDYKEVLKKYWEELLDSPHEEIRQFALDLFTYNLITTGGNFTKNGIFNLTPIRWIKDSGYAQFMRNAVETFTPGEISFDNFFKNNWFNNDIVKPIKLTTLKQDESDLIYVDKYPTLRVSDINKPAINGVPLMFAPYGNPIGKSATDTYGRNQYKDVYRPYYKVVMQYDGNPKNTLLYRFMGTVEIENKRRPLYVLVNKKGLNLGGRTIKEYTNYLSSWFSHFNNTEAAYKGVPTSNEDLKVYLNKFNINIIPDWVNTFDPVYDYSPSTKALRMWFGEDNVNTKNLIEDLIVKQNEQLSSLEDDSVEDNETENDLDPETNKTPATVQEQTELSTKLEDAISKAVNQTVKEINKKQDDIKHLFLFTDGFVIETPFELNDLQCSALLELENFVKNSGSYGNKIALTGYAGTGKTTVIGLFAKWLSHKFVNVKYSSPTHRANAVTRLNNPTSKVFTLHKLFGLKPTIDLEKGYDLRNTKDAVVNEPKLKPGDLVIVDECSMINDALYHFLTESIDDLGISIIYVGDRKQLSPVQDSKDGSDNISLVFTDPDLKQVLLTKVERTGDNPILEECTNIRNGEDFSYTTKLINGEGVEYTGDPKRINEILLQVVRDKTFETNPLAFRVLSATNNGVENINRLVHMYRYGNLARTVEVGELLMGYENIYSNSNSKEAEVVICNSLDYRVTRVEDENTFTVNLNLHTEKGILEIVIDNIISQEFSIVPVFNFDNEIKAPKSFRIISNKNSDEVLTELHDAMALFKIMIDSDWKLVKLLYKEMNNADNRAAYNIYSEERKKARKRIEENTAQLGFLKENALTMQNIVVKGALMFQKSLDYGYAHTIHKSQGGTYGNVMILADTINSFNNNILKLQLKYVAMTRAKHRVTVFTKHELNGQSIQTQALPQVNLKMDINDNPSTKNDPANFANANESLNVLNSNKTILTNAELRILRPYIGDKPRIAVASEHSDPFQYANRIIDILDGKAYVQNKIGLRFTGKDFAALYIITKADGIPIKKLLQYKIPKLIHFSITGLGGTKWEPHVMDAFKLLDKIEGFIKEGLNPDEVTVRVDPIVPGVSDISENGTIEQIVKRATEMGIKHIRFSVMDRYTENSKATRTMKALNYDFAKYYDNDYSNRHAKPEFRKQIEDFMIGLKHKYNFDLTTCAEPTDANNTEISREACLSVNAVNNMLGTNISQDKQGHQREYCSCFGGKVDLLSYDDKCNHCCGYCYAAQLASKEFYNEDGTLKENMYEKPVPQKEINIYSRDNNGYQKLSNFAIRPFTLKNIRFISVEQAFQAMKALVAKDTETYKKIMQSTNSSEIKSLGRDVKNLDLIKWNLVKYNYMKRLIAASFSQNASDLKLLLSTGNAKLTHKDANGNEQYGGHFSKILMEVRDYFKNNKNVNSVVEASKYVNHSGAAHGADTFWDLIGRKYGVIKHIHYRAFDDISIPPMLKSVGVLPTLVNLKLLEYARDQILKLLGVTYDITSIVGKKQARNYYQVVNSDGVFAIATLNGSMTSVSGGTDTAVKLGISMKKSVYVWDTNSEKWYEYDHNDRIFKPTQTPRLTNNFAGVGTRNIEDYNIKSPEGNWVKRDKYLGAEKEAKAKKAINDVYVYTLTGKMPQTTSDALIKEFKGSLGIYSRIQSIPYTKNTPSLSGNQDKAFIFTENAQAYAATHPNMRIESDPYLKSATPQTVRLMVSDASNSGITNTAVIRSLDGVTLQPRVFGIPVKKYLQLNGFNGNFAHQEGQWKDTDSDFEMFNRFCEDFFKCLKESGLSRVVTPSSMALGRAALPFRFAKRLLSMLKDKLGIPSSIEKTKQKDYKGYGLVLGSENNILNLLELNKKLFNETGLKDNTRKSYSRIITSAWGNIKEVNRVSDTILLFSLPLNQMMVKFENGETVYISPSSGILETDNIAKLRKDNNISDSSSKLFFGMNYLLEGYFNNNFEQMYLENFEEKDGPFQLKDKYDNSKDSAEEQWSKKEGWSIEYFRRKELPKIKRGEAYLMEFKLAPNQNAKPDFEGRMDFVYDSNKRNDIKSNTTLDAIKNGERTATTRHTSEKNISYWSLAKVGDIIRFYQKQNPNNYVLVELTKALTKLNYEDFVKNDNSESGAAKQGQLFTDDEMQNIYSDKNRLNCK